MMRKRVKFTGTFFLNQKFTIPDLYTFSFQTTAKTDTRTVNTWTKWGSAISRNLRRYVVLRAANL